MSNEPTIATRMTEPKFRARVTKTIAQTNEWNAVTVTLVEVNLELPFVPSAGLELEINGTFSIVEKVTWATREQRFRLHCEQQKQHLDPRSTDLRKIDDVEIHLQRGWWARR